MEDASGKRRTVGGAFHPGLYAKQGVGGGGGCLLIGCPRPQVPAPQQQPRNGRRQWRRRRRKRRRRRQNPGRPEPPEPESSLWPESDLRIIHQEGAMELHSKEQSSSPQKQGVKARSKSTEEIQPAKKAFQTSQKSLPNQMDGDESKGSCPVSAPSPTQQEQQQQT